MSSDVPMYDEELKELEDQVADCIRAMDRLSGDQRLEKYSKATELLKRINKTFHLFKVEVRMLDGADQAVYEKKSAEHNTTISQLKDQLNQKRAEVNSSGGGGAAGSPTTPGSPGGARGDGKDEARAATQRISKTQNKTLESLKMTEQLVSESETIGNDTAKTLQKQTQQIRNINENLDQLDSEVNRAKKELNAFIRRMMTDKIILCFAVLIIIGIIVIVVVRVQFPPSKEKTEPVTVPPSPSPAPTSS